MEIKFKLNLKPLILTIVSFTVAAMTANGTIQNYIHFADAINEIGFFVISIVAGIIGLFSSFEKSQSK
jgi:hypothetical protein